MRLFKRTLAALVGLAIAFAPLASAVAASGPRPEGVRAAPEDDHWWLGQHFLPLELRENIAEVLGDQWIFGDPSTVVDVSHLFYGLVVLFIGLGLALSARRKIKDELLPPSRWGAAAFFDIVMEGILSVLTSMMPRERALRFLPAMTAVFIFILFSNLLGLIPGFLPPTANLNTTLALGIMAFLYYNYQGIRAHGLLKHLAHFAGPIPVLAPLMIPIEIISHMVRPLSLAIRLVGNMFGDHFVLFIFVAMGVPLLPLPVMILGLLVCIIQAVVFTMLFMVYVALATETHDHDHAHDEHDHEHDAGHVPAPAH